LVFVSGIIATNDGSTNAFDPWAFIYVPNDGFLDPSLTFRTRAATGMVRARISKEALNAACGFIRFFAYRTRNTPDLVLSCFVIGSLYFKRGDTSTSGVHVFLLLAKDDKDFFLGTIVST